MISISLENQDILLAFWLCFTRILTILFQLPLFDRVGIPSLVKILTSLVLTVAFFPNVEAIILSEIQYMGENAFIGLTFFHAISGLAIGFLVKSMLSMFLTAGAVITQQVGLGAVRYFDPQSSEQIGPIEGLLQTVMVIIILMSGALIPMFKGLLISFETLPVYNMALLGNMSEFFVKLFSKLFETSILLASPLVFTNLVLTLIMGIVARLVPQMNILMVSFVVYIGIGLMVITIVSFELFHVGYNKYVEALGMWFNYLRV